MMAMAFMYFKPSKSLPVAQNEPTSFGDFIRPPSTDTLSAIAKSRDRRQNDPNSLLSSLLEEASPIDALGDLETQFSNIGAAIGLLNQRLKQDLPCCLKEYQESNRNHPANERSRNLLAADLKSIGAGCHDLGNRITSLQPSLNTIVAAYHAYNFNLTNEYENLMLESSHRRITYIINEIVFNMTGISPLPERSYQIQVERNRQARSKIQPEILVLDTASSDLSRITKLAPEIGYELDELIVRLGAGGNPAFPSSSSLEASATPHDWYWQLARKHGVGGHAQLAKENFEAWWDRLEC